MEARFPTHLLSDTLEDWELCFVTERDKRFEAADGEIITMEVKEEEGIALRGLKNGRLSFSYTFEKGDKAASDLVGNATELMPFLDADPCYALPGGFASYPGLELYDAAGLAASDDTKTAALLDMESAIRSADKRIVKTRNCELHETEIDVRIINSHGLSAEAKKTLYSLSALAVAKEGDDEVSWYDWAWSSRLSGLDGRALAAKIAEKAVSALGAELLDTGVYNGVLTPACACQVLEILAPSFLSENLYKRKTRLADKAGVQCFSGVLTVVDSGTRGAGAFPFDGEGVPSRENVLVDKGVFRGFLYDTCYGKRLGSESTGNAVRGGVKEPPRCGTRGLIIEAGDTKGPDAGEGGIVVEELMGTHTANGVTGDFSVGAIGSRKLNNKWKPFKGVILSGNLFELLNAVRAVGNDLTFYGPYGSPTLFIEGLKISGK